MFFRESRTSQFSGALIIVKNADEKNENYSLNIKKMDASKEIDSNNKFKNPIENEQEDCRSNDEELQKDSRGVIQTDEEGDKCESPKQEVNAHILQRAIQKLYSDPSFAVICSFFNKFAVFLGLKPQNFAKMENMFTSFHITGRVDRDLIDLHLMLMRKLTFKSARLEVWEKYLLKFCSLIPSLETEYLQLERYGYLHTTVATKLAILKTLCESQFDFNIKFKESLLNSCAASDLRLLPIGYDKEGLAYLYQQDADLVIRIYSAEQDDHSGGSWNLVAKCKEELENLVAELKNRLASKYLSNLLKQHEDSSSAPAVAEIGEQINVLSTFTTKRGALLDIYQDESAVKKKFVKSNQMRKKAAVEEESKKENSAPPTEIIEDIPDEVKPFLDRRVLPRRSARSAAINQLKELTAPLKPQSGKRKSQQNKKQMEIENAKQLKILDRNDDQDDSEDNDENEKDENDADDFILAETSTSSDDDFMPLSELKKKNQNSRRRRGRKIAVEKDPFEMVESEEDEDSDDDQEKKAKKERKKATEETLCMKCSKSSNPEVLLLCDLCDEAWHTWCLHPILWYVPDDDWFCPNCQQAMLIEKFSEVLTVLAEQVKRKAAEDKKKEAAAERLKREMEYIGVSLNNIIDTVRDAKVENSESSEESGEDDGERKSKKKAIRRLGVHPQKPIVPIALSRSRRHVAKVDYKFGAYDELIQEAVKNIDESAARQMNRANVRPKSGAGRGKDMANIINAENKRIPISMENNQENDGFDGQKAIKMQSKIGKPTKNRHRLNDLNVDEMTESDTDEYQASDSASVSDPSDDTDEYLPSDASCTRRAFKRNYYSNKRTQSDDDFVVSGSESEYEPSRKKSHKSKNTRKIKGKRKREKWISSEEDSISELSDNYQSEESNSSGDRRARRRPVTKWAPRASSSDAEDSSHSVQKTAAGRPLRKAVAKRPSLTVDNDGDEEEEEDEEEIEERLKNVRPIGTGRKIESSDEFEPDEEEEEVEDEEEEVEDEEEEENEETSTIDDEKQRQSDEEEGLEEKERKIVKVENDMKDMKEITFSSTKTSFIDDDKKQTEDIDDVCPSTSNDVKLTDETAHKVKSKQIDQEIFYTESAKTEDVKKLEVKVSEKMVVSNMTATNSNVTSCVPPSCFPSTSADPSALNPSSVMQQMARLASSSATPVQQYDPSYRNIVQTTAPTFIPNGAPLHIYSGPVPVTVYQVQQPTFVRTPASIIQPSAGPVSQGWSPYPPSNSFPPNVTVPSMVTATTTSSPTTDSETLGNVLASAMDY
uniref:PHD-type domain-containing protein n=1 Tax=Onchocerca volvulus TaxID=6282 RepID=A0A8R1XVP4_ONCVO